MIIMNLPSDSISATVVILCSATVAVLSLPLPLFPLVELLTMYVDYVAPQSRRMSHESLEEYEGKRPVLLRLAILLFTSCCSTVLQARASCTVLVTTSNLSPLVPPPPLPPPTPPHVISSACGTPPRRSLPLWLAFSVVWGSCPHSCFRP